MAKNFDQLNAAGTLTGAETVPVNQSGTTVKVTTAGLTAPVTGLRKSAGLGGTDTAAVVGTDYLSPASNLDATKLTGTVADARLSDGVRGAASYALRNAPAEAGGGIDTRLAGKTASTATYNIFSAGNFTTGAGFVRNVGLWCADLAPYLTCFSPSNSNEGPYQGGTLITPKHALFAEHFSGATGSNILHAGDTVKFVALDNTIYTRTLTATPVRVGTTDLCVGTFVEADLPSAIQPAIILPGGFNVQTFPAGTAVVYTNKNKEVHVAEIADFSMRTIGAATGAGRGTWSFNPPIAGGDSGSPIYIFNGGQLLLWQLATDAAGSGDYIGANAAAINAILPTGYSLQIATTNILPLGLAAFRGTAGGAGALAGLDPTTSKLPPEVIPPYSGSSGGIPVEQLWDAANNNPTLATSTTLLRVTSSPPGGGSPLFLPGSSTYGRAVTIVIPANFLTANPFSFQDTSGGAGPVQTYIIGGSSLSNGATITLIATYSALGWTVSGPTDGSQLTLLPGKIANSNVTYASSIALDFGGAPAQTLILTGDVTFVTPINAVGGHRVVWVAH